MNIMVPVKQEHIDKGERGIANKCPVAWAARDVFPACSIRVSNHEDCQTIGSWWVLSIKNPLKGIFLSFHLSSDVGRRLDKFDMGGGMEPFDLTFNL